MTVTPARFLVALAVLIVATTTSAETKREIKPGFRDMTLGAPKSQLKGADCDAGEKILNATWQRCSRPSDRLQIGDAVLTEISYVFLEEQLWFVEFHALGPNCGKLETTIRSVYGEPQWDYSDRLYQGARTRFHIVYADELTRMMCLDRSDDGTCSCDIRSLDLHKRYTDMKRREAVGDL